MMNPSNSPSIDRKQSLLRRSLSTPSLIPNCGGGGGGSTAAEFCGGAAASCAALWCCGPCSVVNLVVLAVYKVPREIGRRAIRRVRQRRLTKKKKGIREESGGECEKKLSKSGSSQFAVHPLESKEEVNDFDESKEVRDLTEEEEEEDEEVIALEKEMWNRFYSGGFWRSLSQAETNSSPISDFRDL